ncbi:MAG: DEAD/DEAH box helicase [Propionibacteriaceae bacterium]|nr:DEAD/DEAH box helicase [Propionibacteriaceae bacterium]
MADNALGDLDIFHMHRTLIDDYRSFTEGAIDIHDARIRESVREQADLGGQWPDPFLSINPSFESGGTVQELADRGILHPRTAELFRREGSTESMSLYRHQTDAIEAARQQASYVLTTGTGSGKSLAYMLPIVDYVLKHPDSPGIKAIVVYPMNALANSQENELRGYLHEPALGTPGAVTYARYTGQESQERREEIAKNPPDILLTNYVMLELLLTRPDERSALIEAARGLRFLVLDELHTYRGRQGADVAMLVRRVRQATGAGDHLLCVGTSATMSSEGTQANQRSVVASVATRIFGTTVTPDHVITETLVLATEGEPQIEELQSLIDARGRAESNDPRLNHDYEALRHDALAVWIENVFGLDEEPGTPPTLIRRAPTTVADASALLNRETGRPFDQCKTAIQQTLLAGSRTRDPSTGRPLFAFRLHQFISKGASVYVSLEDEATRAIEHEYRLTLSATRPDGSDERRLFPLAFCRDCGQEYLMVTRKNREDHFVARTQIRILEKGGDASDGYLLIDSDNPWPNDPIDRLPDSWVESRRDGPAVIKSRKDDVPQTVIVDLDGHILPHPSQSMLGKATRMTWIPGQLMFCLTCGTTYHQKRDSEAGKVAALDQEGRSSATTVLSLSVLKSLDRAHVEREVRKLLTFVDNRQDASLQSGHINDFVLVAQLRSAVRAATEAAGEEGITPLDYADILPRYLRIDRSHYAQDPNAFSTNPIDSAFALVAEYRALQDLRRGWRVTLPNLEQTGLIRVDYPTARRLCAAESRWETAHPALRDASPAQREEIVCVLLDEFRRVLALHTEVFSEDHLRKLQRLSVEYLTGLWTVEEGERADPGIVTLATPRNLTTRGLPKYQTLTRGSLFGRWLARRLSERKGEPIDGAEYETIIRSLMAVLAEGGIVAHEKYGTTDGYTLKLDQIRIVEGSGDHGASDPIRSTRAAERGPRVNPYFKEIYQLPSKDLAFIVAQEHTAQVRAEDRESREAKFRKGELPLLYCSPTMELGVDISSLNAVAMRNVPPTPANYAQRSGRAGRSGSPALVVTYCASGNAHDSYYFKHRDQMVAGQVKAPQIDLTNEDLLRSHIHAIWLAFSGARLGQSMTDVLITPPSDRGSDPAAHPYPIKPEIRECFSRSDVADRAKEAAHLIISPFSDELSETSWWNPTWTDEVINDALENFDHACDRWRMLDRTSLTEMTLAFEQLSDLSADKRQRENAKRRMDDAAHERALLKNDSGSASNSSDFYPYRYFASEGFLPGYSFPRLPLAAFIPGRTRSDNAWIQRPRFLALNEFGPNAFIYHEGARYQVTRVNLPRGGGDVSGMANLTLREARVCENCGYHHDREIGADLCENCGVPLNGVTRNLLPLQMVRTRRRDRIGANEEERQRAGFDIHTTYRFARRGDTTPQPIPFVDADDRIVATVQYGDAAEIRRVNLGLKRRTPGESKDATDGFWLDTVEGQWLSNKKAADLELVSEEGAPFAEDVTRKARVIPYVEDHRNIAVVQWGEELDTTKEVTLMYAIERGVETFFQLEDAEVTSELLPDQEKKGRFMLVESAEGGAGALRRLTKKDLSTGEPDALAQVAREALSIIHVDPDTGEDTEDACGRGCYHCLLTYGNQLSHASIDRRVAIPYLLRLASARVIPVSEDPSHRRTSPPDQGSESADAMGESHLIPTGVRPTVETALHYILSHDLAWPSSITDEVEGTPVDLVYQPGQSGPSAVVFIDEEHRPDTSALAFGGWNVVQVEPDDSFERVVRANPSVFGRLSE